MQLRSPSSFMLMGAIVAERMRQSYAGEPVPMR